MLQGQAIMQKLFPGSVFAKLVIAATAAILSLETSAMAEVSLEEMMRKCLLLENFWTLKSTQDITGSIPNDGSAVCFGYLLAFRGLQGAVVGTHCTSVQTCQRTVQFCISEQISDMQILSAFITYAGNHVAHWREGASSHYLNAMNESFPCQDERK
jgi:Rap1a immunity proteins